jgi:hypothetical protein
MKKARFVWPLLAVLVISLASAFTLKKKAPAANQLYWYTVTYDAGNPNGIIQASTDFFTQDSRDNLIPPCDAGVNKDCLRGFSAPLTSFPATAQGMDQVKKP